MVADRRRRRRLRSFNTMLERQIQWGSPMRACAGLLKVTGDTRINWTACGDCSERLEVALLLTMVAAYCCFESKYVLWRGRYRTRSWSCSWMEGIE